MQFIQKYILTISVAALLIIAAYFTVQDILSSQSDEISRNTTIIQDILPQSGKETNTGKSIETVTQSGTGWQMSPFGSGKPVIEDEKKPVFQKPNTEWKTRTLSGITYVFGEGNPPEVAPKWENLDELGGPDGYVQGETVRPKTEQLLASFLSNPVFTYAMNKCGPLMKPQIPDDGLYGQLPYSLYTTDFSMESMISIDPVTGQKTIENNKFGFIANTLLQIRTFEGNENSPKVSVLANQCLSTDEIVQFDALLDQYYAVYNSWTNGSLENRREVCSFIKKDNCNYQE